MSKSFKNLFLISSLTFALTACHTTDGYNDNVVVFDEYDTYPGPYYGYYGEEYDYVGGHHHGGHHHGEHHHHHH